MLLRTKSGVSLSASQANSGKGPASLTPAQNFDQFGHAVVGLGQGIGQPIEQVVRARLSRLPEILDFRLTIG